MKLRWHPASSERDTSSQPSDDGGGAGAEYVDPMPSASDHDHAAEDHAAWYRARHWTPDHRSELRG
jgi:hypothetical protein